MEHFSLNDKVFIPSANEKGLANEETRFHYFQEGDTVTGIYHGGKIKEGRIVGRQTAPNQLALLFQCLTVENELKAGESRGTIEKNAGGKLTLTFEWRWLTGDLSGGHSYYEQV